MVLQGWASVIEDLGSFSTARSRCVIQAGCVCQTHSPHTEYHGPSLLALEAPQGAVWQTSPVCRADDAHEVVRPYLELRAALAQHVVRVLLGMALPAGFSQLTRQLQILLGAKCINHMMTMDTPCKLTLGGPVIARNGPNQALWGLMWCVWLTWRRAALSALATASSEEAA